MCTLYTLAGGHRHSQGEAASVSVNPTLLWLLEDDERDGRQVPEEGVEGVHQDDQRLLHLRAPSNFVCDFILCLLATLSPPGKCSIGTGAG